MHEKYYELTEHLPCWKKHDLNTSSAEIWLNFWALVEKVKEVQKNFSFSVFSKDNIGSGSFDVWFGLSVWLFLRELEDPRLSCEKVYTRVLKELVSESENFSEYSTKWWSKSFVCAKCKGCFARTLLRFWQLLEEIKINKMKGHNRWRRVPEDIQQKTQTEY